MKRTEMSKRENPQLQNFSDYMWKRREPKEESLRMLPLVVDCDLVL